jgi:hypothetical protein
MKLNISRSNVYVCEISSGFVNSIEYNWILYFIHCSEFYYWIIFVGLYDPVLTDLKWSLFRIRNHFHGKCKHDLMTRPSPKKLVKREKVSRKLLRMNEYVKQKSLFQRYNIIVGTRTTKRKRTTKTIKI